MDTRDLDAASAGAGLPPKIPRWRLRAPVRAPSKLKSAQRCADAAHMTARTPEREGIVAPERAAATRRPLRWSVLAAVAEAWIVVALAALAAPRLLIAIVPLAVIYTIAAPPYLRRHLGGHLGRLDHDLEPPFREVHIITDELGDADADVERPRQGPS